MIGDKVGDYIIIESAVVGNAKFVVGESLSNPAPYATCQCNMKNDPHAYFWGHYCADKASAMEDYGKRISEEAHSQKSLKLDNPKEKPDVEPER